MNYKTNSDFIHFIVGDIHGCYEELIELESKIIKLAEKKRKKPFIISVGDLVDRGPESKKVLDHFKQGIQNNTHAVIMGNHELMMLESIEALAKHNFEYLKGEYPEWFLTYAINHKLVDGKAKKLDEYMLAAKSMWVSQGGSQTLESFGVKPRLPDTWKIPSHYIDFLLSLPFIWENEHFVVTHALASQADLNLMRQLYTDNSSGKSIKDIFRTSSYSLIWNRRIPTTNPDPNKLHISGHTPVPKVNKIETISCLQIDTGCVFGGKLTAYCFEENKLLSVKAKTNYTKK